MRRFHATLLLVALATVAHAHERSHRPPWAVERDAPEAEVTADKGGGYRLAPWPGGLVPYEFNVDASTFLVIEGTLSGLSFVAGPTPRIESPSPDDELDRVFGAGDYLVVSGTLHNDNTLDTEYEITAVSDDRITLKPGDSVVSETVASEVVLGVTNRVSFQHIALFEATLFDWEEATGVDFVPRDGEADYVRLFNSSRNLSSVGRVGGRQSIFLDRWASRYAVLHEVGHTLGLHHEHQRPDRDLFVRIEEDNISTTACGGGDCANQFKIAGFAYPTHPSPVYDFASVMHYSRSALAAEPGLDTITVLPPHDAQWQDEIGRSSQLSFWDVKMVQFLYPLGQIEFVWQGSPLGQQNGSFPIPWRSLSDGVGHAPPGGRVAILYPDVYSAEGLWSDPVLLEAPTGGVILE